MKRCMLGCGLIVHDIDEHVDFTHPERRTAEGYDQFPSRDDQYLSYKREVFIEYHFSAVTL